jgi:short-subunit dehydrogenase
MQTRSAPRTIVITGASAGVGRAVVRRFARRSARIGLLARGREGLEAARKEAVAHGGRALAIPTDMADPQQVELAAAKVEEEFGPIDIWINNAMTTVFAPFLDISPEEFRRVTEVSYLGFVNGTRAALKRMLPRDQGAIVQVGSSVSYRGIPLQTAYSGAKHAIQGFSEALREELMHDSSRVRVSVVLLPAINTPQFRWCKMRRPKKWQPVPPIYQPEVAARAVEYAAFHNRREIMVGSATVKTILFDKFFPGFVDWYLAKTGFDSQQYDGASDPDRPDNLWKPVEGDFAARGPFSDRSKGHSLQLTLSMHLGGILTGLGLALGTLLGVGGVISSKRG